MVELIKPLVRATARPAPTPRSAASAGCSTSSARASPIRCWWRRPTGSAPRSRSRSRPDVHDTIGIDLVAMSVNDLVVQGAEPLFFLDYFACGQLEPEVGAAVVKGIAEGCRQANCALIGGETAEMPGLYQAGDYDLAGFAVGAAERGTLLPRADIAAGDVVLGLASSGVHSNGYSLVRKIVAADAGSPGTPLPRSIPRTTLGAALIEPTRIYVTSCLAAIRETQAVKALAHITGGGFTENIPRVLPKGLGAEIDLSRVPVPPVFNWLAATGGVAQSRDAAHLQLRHRHGGGGGGKPRRRGRRRLRRRRRDCGSPRQPGAGRSRGCARQSTPDGSTSRKHCGQVDGGSTLGQEARRRPDLRPRLEHGGADRGGEGAPITPPRSRSFCPIVPMPRGLRVRAPRASPPPSSTTRASARTAKLRARAPRRARSSTGIDLVCLAGFMRMLTPWLVGRWQGRMLNIHPALLPAFKGLDTHERALAAGVKIHGATRAFRGPRNGLRPDHRAGRRAGARRRRRRRRSPRACSRSSIASIRWRSRWWRRTACGSSTAAASSMEPRKARALSSCRRCANHPAGAVAETGGEA